MRIYLVFFLLYGILIVFFFLFFVFLVCPRIRYGSVSTDVLSCFVQLRLRVPGMNLFCENPLAYSRYARVEIINGLRFQVVSLQRVFGICLGPCILAPSLFGGDIVRGIICSSCNNTIGYFGRRECYFMDSYVVDLWRGRDNHLIDSDHDSDSGNDTESDIQYDNDDDAANVFLILVYPIKSSLFCNKDIFLFHS